MCNCALKCGKTLQLIYNVLRGSTKFILLKSFAEEGYCTTFCKHNRPIVCRETACMLLTIQYRLLISYSYDDITWVYLSVICVLGKVTLFKHFSSLKLIFLRLQTRCP